MVFILVDIISKNLEPIQDYILRWYLVLFDVQRYSICGHTSKFQLLKSRYL